VVLLLLEVAIVVVRELLLVKDVVAVPIDAAIAEERTCVWRSVGLGGLLMEVALLLADLVLLA